MIYASVTDPELIGSVGQSPAAIFARPVDDRLSETGRVTPQSNIAADLRSLCGSTRLSFDLRLCARNTFAEPSVYGQHEKHNLCSKFKPCVMPAGEKRSCSVDNWTLFPRTRFEIFSILGLGL